MKYNEHLVNVSIHISSGVPYTTSEQYLGAEILKHGSIDLRPSMVMYQYNDIGCWLWIKESSYNLYYKATVARTGGAYGNFTYARK